MCLSSRESNRGSGIGILCLRDLIFRTEPEETRTPPSTQKSNSGLGDHDQESCHASTGSHTAGTYLVFRLGNPEGFIPILWDVPKSNLCAVEDVGALVEWAREQPLFCPDSGQEMAVLHNQNKMVTQFGMSAYDECFTWQETTKRPMTLITFDKFRIPHTDNCLVCQLGDPGTARENETPVVFAFKTSCRSKSASSHISDTFTQGGHPQNSKGTKAD